MSDDRLLLEMRRQHYKTNHILHFLLTIFTLGLWVMVWLLMALSNSHQRGKVERQIMQIEEPDRIRDGSLFLIVAIIFTSVMVVLWLFGAL